MTDNSNLGFTVDTSDSKSAEEFLFTQEVSKWLNIFLDDLEKDPNIVLSKLSDFPGDHEIVKRAILESPEIFASDEVACKQIFNFVEYYATGNISNIEVSLKDSEIKYEIIKEG